MADEAMISAEFGNGMTNREGDADSATLATAVAVGDGAGLWMTALAVAVGALTGEVPHPTSSRQSTNAEQRIMS